MDVTSLASGSSGNACLVRAGDVKVIFDCGLSARKLAQELLELGVHPSELRAVFLSHGHSDHIKSAHTLSRRYHLPVIANEATLRSLRSTMLGLSERMPTGTTTNIGPLSITSFPLPHDASDTVGYFVQCGDRSVCIATDLGQAPDHLVEYLRASDLMILESNHDVDLLVKGPYPWYLKQRVLGPYGHLSNADSAAAVVRANSGRRQTLWLAHLSEINNTPELATRTVEGRLRQEGISSIEVEVALRDGRSLVWEER